MSSTLNLKNQDAALLLTFLSLYTVMAGTSIWRIAAFCVHQGRVQQGIARRDAYFHQQQAVLRNVETPVGATWQLLRLSFAWRNRVRNPFARSVKLVAFASLATVGVVAAVLMTSKVVTGGVKSNGYQSISTVGVGTIVALGTLIIVLGSCFDTCVGSINVYLYGQSGRLAWALDEKLQLQRMAYEGHGWGPFTKGASLVPVTEKDVLLGLYDIENPNHPTISKNTSPSSGTGFWIDRRRGSVDMRPSTMDSVSEKAMLAQAQAYAEARGRAFAWTVAPNGGETRGSSIVVGGLGGASHLRIVNGGMDGTRPSSVATFGTRRHSIASTGFANNHSHVSIVSNLSATDRKSHASMPGASHPRDSGFADNPSLVSVASSLGPNGRISQLSTTARASGTTVFREHFPDLQDLLRTDTGTTMVQQYAQHLLSPPPVQGPSSQSQVKQYRHSSPLQYEHQQEDDGGEYEHRVEIYGSREYRGVELARLDGGGDVGSCRMRDSGVSGHWGERRDLKIESQDFGFADDGEEREELMINN